MPQVPPLPPIATEPLSVVLLAPGAGAASAVLAGWLAFLDGLGREYELLLVVGGSAEASPDPHPRLRLLPHAGPWGEGAALRAGLAAASHPLVFYTLCEPQYRPADLGRLLERRTPAPKEEPEIDHVHLLSGYRAGVPVPWPWRVVGALWRLSCRVLLSYTPPPLPGWLGWRGHLGRLLARVVFGIRYHDVACPFRLLRRQILARIPIQSGGPFAHVELLAKANFLGYVMGEEMPLDVRPRPMPGGWRAVWREGWRVFREPDFGPPP
jgi:hypothetical protein